MSYVIRRVEALLNKDLTIAGNHTFSGDQTFTGAVDLSNASSVTFATGTASIVASDASSGGNNSATAPTTATYTVIGNQCIVAFSFATAIDITGMAGANDFYLTGLPFASATKASTHLYSGTVITNGVTFGSDPKIVVLDGTSYARLSENVSAGGTDYLTVTQLSGGRIYCQLQYEI